MNTEEQKPEGQVEETPKVEESNVDKLLEGSGMSDDDIKQLKDAADKLVKQFTQPSYISANDYLVALTEDLLNNAKAIAGIMVSLVPGNDAERKAAQEDIYNKLDDAFDVFNSAYVGLTLRIAAGKHQIEVISKAKELLGEKPE